MAVEEKVTDEVKRGALPSYFYRLSARAQRVWLKSDAIERLDLQPDAEMLSLAAALVTVVSSGSAARIAVAAQALTDRVCRSLRVRPVKVEVRGVRPHNARGELHGIFYPRGPAMQPGLPLIVLWMRTAQRRDVVKPRTFVRTLMHELGHYLDYVLLGLDDSYHTTGFFKRESFLMRTLLPSAPRSQ